jgi:hypothetical protein
MRNLFKSFVAAVGVVCFQTNIVLADQTFNDLQSFSAYSDSYCQGRGSSWNGMSCSSSSSSSKGPDNPAAAVAAGIVAIAIWRNLFSSGSTYVPKRTAPDREFDLFWSNTKHDQPKLTYEALLDSNFRDRMDDSSCLAPSARATD